MGRFHRAALAGEFEGELPRWVPRTESGRLDLADRMNKASEVLAERTAKNAKKPSGKPCFPRVAVKF